MSIFRTSLPHVRCVQSVSERPNSLNIELWDLHLFLSSCGSFTSPGSCLRLRACLARPPLPPLLMAAATTMTVTTPL
ncbi:hypothetical protein FA13DRAFT_731893 [Coprinellus micaceus]|uniref:Uncharacterized protein n=1 Tax=Coprinellus micaceus TaxID=71717 RepID=A0A4Y7TWA6_COPMI|nr:hypothetical protein FA13DRAFT_731893 [Coprinellus micaceus]